MPINELDAYEMKTFAINLIRESSVYKNKGIIGERIIILHLDHANELLMKSFLIKRGYIINYIEKGDLKNGVKKDEFLDKSKTLYYEDCLKLVCKNITNFNENKRNKMLTFHKIRNEIQHRAINLDINKHNEIATFYPCFEELYTKMFPNDSVNPPNLDTLI